MDENIKKQVGRIKNQDYLERLQQINAALKKLGCSFKNDDRATVFKKIVGRTIKT